MPQQNCIFLLPLKNAPVFKIAVGANLDSYLTRSKLASGVDTKHVVAVCVQNSDREAVLGLKYAMKVFLLPYSATGLVPDAIDHGRNDFFRSDAWERALDLLEQMKKYGWDLGAPKKLSKSKT